MTLKTNTDGGRTLNFNELVLEVAQANDTAVSIRKTLNEQVTSNNERYMPEYVGTENDRLTAEANDKLDKLVAAEQNSLDLAIANSDNEITSRFLDSGMTADIAAELDQLAKVKPGREEMQLYVNKFKASPLALRRLGVIAQEQGYAVSGPTYDELTRLRDCIKREVQNVVSGLRTANTTLRTIGLNIATDYVNSYNKLLASEFTVSVSETVARINRSIN